jgi:hypothetical protein
VSFSLTGWLFQWLGAVVVMMADALTYVASALLLLKISEPPPLKETPAAAALQGRLQALVSEVQAGMHYRRARSVLRGWPSSPH